MPSFKSYSRGKFNAGTPKKKSNKKKEPQKNEPQHPSLNEQHINSKSKEQSVPKDTDHVKSIDNDKHNKSDQNEKSSDLDDNQKNEKKEYKISSYKLAQRKKHRQSVVKKKLSELHTNLTAMGFNPTNMSLKKQRKIFDREMRKLATKKAEEEAKKEAAEESSEEEIIPEDPFAFLKENDMKKSIAKHEQKQEEEMEETMKQKIKRNKGDMDMEIDLDFGDVIKPELEKELELERIIRTGKTSQKVSDRQLLRKLKRRERVINQHFSHKKVFIDEHLLNETMQKLRGEQVKDLKFLKQKLGAKNKRKKKARSFWKDKNERISARVQRKNEKKQANIDAYIERKINRRKGKNKRISTETAITKGREA